MNGGYTPDGDHSPPVLHESQVCIADVQQTVCKDVTIAADDVTPGGEGSKASLLLFISHLIEITAMVTATVFRSFPQNLPSEESFYILIGINLGILFVPLLIVTSISLAWVLRVQDFSGRFLARLVCWLLHILQSSLIWRYLKIQIAFEPGDLSELVMLRFIQIHIHTLPFLVLHFMIMLSFPRSLGISLCLPCVILLTIAVTIVAATSASYTIATPTFVHLWHSSRAKSQKLLSLNKARLFMGATTICVLWSRVISLAALFCVHAIWAAAVVLIHWILAVIWLGFQEQFPFNSREILRRGFLGYLLVWDWHIYKEEETACSQPRNATVYYIIVASQNIASICAWYLAKRVSQTSLFHTSILISFTVAQTFGLVCIIFSYLYISSSSLSYWYKRNTSSVPRKQWLVTATNKTVSSDVTPNGITFKADHHPFGEYTDLTEELRAVSTCSNDVSITPSREDCKEDPLPELIKSHRDAKDNKVPQSIPTSFLSKQLQCSVYSYSNDILQHTFKSERSSTDNGSFNSRNTNTLPTSGSVLPDYDNNCKQHGSFSDSYSSLSCGTDGKMVTSTPKGHAGYQMHPNKRKTKYLKACQNSCCRGPITERLPDQYPEVEEELNNDIEQMSLTSLDKNVSLTSVAVVKTTQRFHIVCIKCMHAHDPLLTRCKLQNSFSDLICSPGNEKLDKYPPFERGGGDSSTDYPSDTEMTTTADTLSSVSADSRSTYTTWPVGRNQGLAKLLVSEKEGNDYVTAWLQHQEIRQPPASSRHVSFQSHRKKLSRNRYLPQIPSTGRCKRITKRHWHKSKPRLLNIIQDLETVV